MYAIHVEVFIKPTFDKQGKTTQVSVICIQAPRTTTLTDYARSKKILEDTFNVTIIKETIHEMPFTMDESLKGIQLIALEIEKNQTKEVENGCTSN